MKFNGPAFFDEDVELDNDIKVNGPLIAQGSIKVPYMKVNGPVDIKSSLYIGEEIKINGPLIVNDSIVLADDSYAKVNGPLDTGVLEGQGLVKVNGALKTDNVSLKSLIMNGNVTVTNNIEASESLTFGIDFKTKFDVEGTIEAPIITFRRKRRTPNIGKIILGAIGLGSRKSYSSVEPIILEGLKIRAKTLRLAGVEISGDIEAETIEHLDPEEF